MSPAPRSSDPSAGPRVARWMRITLFFSLALNLVVVGLVAGAVIHRRLDGPPAVVLRDMHFGSYTEAFSREDRAAMRQEFRRNVPALREMRQAQQAEQAQLLDALRAAPFDPVVVRDVLTRQRERSTAGMELGQAAILDRIEAMSEAERAAFADRLEEGFARRGARKSGQRGDRNPD